MSYLGKLSPTVGNGLGGLPRRTCATSAVKKIPFSKENVINRNIVSIAGLATGNISIGFTIIDPARVTVKVHTAIGDGQVMPYSHETILCAYNNNVKQEASKTDPLYNIVYKLSNSTTLNVVTNNNDFVTYFEIIEYDFSYTSIELLSPSATTTAWSAGVLNLTNEIINPQKCLLVPTISGDVNSGSQYYCQPYEFSTTYPHISICDASAQAGFAARLSSSTTVHYTNTSISCKLYLYNFN